MTKKPQTKDKVPAKRLDPEGSMTTQDTDGMISISGRWWSFPGAQIDGDSWEVESCGDGQLRLRDCVGNVIEGRELSEAKVEQLERETLLADVLELAAAKLRSECWDESVVADVLNEILHAYPKHVKKALALALLWGRF